MGPDGLQDDWRPKNARTINGFNTGLSREAYDPDSNNPHRWWNNGKGLPDRLG